MISGKREHLLSGGRHTIHQHTEKAAVTHQVWDAGIEKALKSLRKSLRGETNITN